MGSAPYRWPICRQVHERARRTRCMIDRLEIDASALARDHDGDIYAGVHRTCFECCHSNQCRRWLLLNEPTAPEFCPNLKVFLRYRKRPNLQEGDR